MWRIAGWHQLAEKQSKENHQTWRGGAQLARGGAACLADFSSALSAALTCCGVAMAWLSGLCWLYGWLAINNESEASVNEAQIAHGA